MFDALMQPIQLAETTIPNRVVRTAHSTGSPWVDTDDSLIAYHEARARGGVGLSILEIAGVHLSSPTLIPVWDDQVVDGYRKIADAVRPHGMKVFQQLWHGGNCFPMNMLGGPPWSASDVPNPDAGVVPVPMSKDQIDEVVASFGAAARRVKDGGLDGVEVHGAHGYLVGQFMSPATNRRTDEYGGSFENRCRFLVEILHAMREAVGSDFPVGVRLVGDEGLADGLHPEDALRVAKMIEPLVDFIDMSLGSYYRFYKMLSPMDDPLGYELPHNESVTRELDVPTIVTGRIMTLDHANHIVESGVADMVSMVRALIADPDLVKKTLEGRSNEVRPCISSSQGCVGGLLTTGKMSCVVNVAAGQELTTPFEVPGPADERRKVLVVGGGPAGLEAARTAALRGHDVVLYELTNHLGGQNTIAAAAPHRSDIGAIGQWLASEVERLKVTVRLRSPVDPDVVADEAPDVVIIATGSTPRRDGFQASHPAYALPGVNLPHVYTSWDLLGFGGRATVGTSAVVYDDTNSYEAISAADALHAAEARVTFVTRHDTIGSAVPAPPATVLPAKERLFGSSDFTFVPQSYLKEITPMSVTVSVLHSDLPTTIEADTVVIVGFNTPNRELADALPPGTPVHVVGDAAGGRTLQQAISEASAVARAI